MADEQITVLQAIVDQVAIELFNQWVGALPESERTEEALGGISRNAKNTTLFVINSFMDKFNKAAEELKDQD